jgi:general secretion pathway protein J
MKQRGFTLLEMIIGITLLGLVLVLLYGGLRLGARGWDAGDKAIEANSRQVLVAEFLRRQLSLIYPMRWRKADGVSVLAFSGEPHSISFAGPLPARHGQAGVHIFTLDTFQEDGSGTLRLRWRFPDRDLNAFEFSEEKDRSLLAAGVTSLDIEYFGAEQLGADAAWHESWHAETQLPERVRVKLALKGAETWQDIVVPLRLNEAHCQWDPVYKRCL